MTKEIRRRNWEAKRLRESRFRPRVETPKPVRKKKHRPSKKEILDYGFNEDLPSDV